MTTSNYLDLLNKINKNTDQIKYDNYLIEFIKSELSVECDKNKDGLIMRGNFRKSHFETIILKFVKKSILKKFILLTSMSLLI